MKKILALILTFAIVNNLSAQTRKKTVVSMYKESAKVDSLFDSIIHSNSSAHRYFAVRSVKDQYEQYFEVIETEIKFSNIELDVSKDEYSKNFGFFKFKNCIVFVAGNEIPSNLFNKTNNFSSFHFIWNVRDGEDPFKRRDRLFSVIYIYKKGKFCPFVIGTDDPNGATEIKLKGKIIRN